MRLSRPHLRTSISTYKTPISNPRYKSSSSPKAPESTQLPWLSALKATQLQHLARATGIKSSGTKSILTQRISNTLSNHSHQIHQKQSSQSNPEPWRILSIDMGIQNLAFAHLLVPAPFSEKDGELNTTPPTIAAWRRVAVSELIQKSDPNTFSEEEKSTSPLEFTPALYASAAYEVMTTLLSTYNPTHIIIERQRFRSGGGSAVQEWTLRVGVFEGMLYAVLKTLRAERGNGPFVESVEPKRVVGFLGESKDGIAKTAREVKRMKIDVVGRWLEKDERCLRRVLVGRDVEVDGYLRRWKGVKDKKNNNKDKDNGGTGVGAGIGKLDDLADCLLQGVTWLEWQVMRERILREGVGALEGLKGF